MAKDERISTPQSSTGIIRFYDTETGGPKLDPKGVVVFSVALILIIKIIDMVIQ
ncbi:MAG: preprotein translocase subunit Sec61beta [Candidatus Micrarchaeota archaeon]